MPRTARPEAEVGMFFAACRDETTFLKRTMRQFKNVPIHLLALLLLLLAGCGGSEPESAANQEEAEIPSDRMLPTPDQVAEQEAATAPKTPADEFIGAWAVKDDDGEVFNIIIMPEGKAITNFTKGESGVRGEFGEWVLEDDHIRLHYDSGWKDILAQSEDGYLKLGYAPGITLNDQPSNEDKAEKITGPVVPFLGVWYRKASLKEKKPWFLALRSDRSAQRSDNPEATGQWEIHNNGNVVIKWSDGPVTSLLPNKPSASQPSLHEDTKDAGGKQLHEGDVYLVVKQMGDSPEEEAPPEDPESMEDVSLEPVAPEGS